MKILDRYIGKKFLYTFFFISLLVIFLIYIFDYMQKGNYFFEQHLSRKLIFDYYKAYLPYMYNFTMPIIVFITAIFTTSQLAKRSEVLAILGMGIHYRRFLCSFLLPATLLTGFNFYINGWVIPKNNVHWIDFEEKYMEDDSSSNGPKSNLHFKVNDDRYVSIGKYKSIQKVGYRIIIDTFQENELQTRITADKMFYDNEKNIWVLSNWMQRVLNEEGEDVTSGDSLETDIILKPNDIAMNPRLHEMLSLTELKQHIKVLKEQGSRHVRVFQMEKNVKYSAPLAIFILTILGVIFASRKSRMGNSFQLLIGCILAFVYIGFFLFVRSLALYSDMNTALLIWLPNIIFFLLSLILYRILPR